MAHILLVLTGLLPFFPPPGPAAAPRAEPDKALEEVRRAAEKATVHAIGIYSPARCGIEPEEIEDWPGLVKTLRAREGAVAAVWRGLDEIAQKTLSRDDVLADLTSGKLSKSIPITADIHWGLGQSLSNPDLFAEADLKGWNLDEDLMKLVRAGRGRGQVQTHRLNRTLLYRVLGGHVPKMPDDFLTVKVRVRSGGPVVLALSSCVQCRWVVSVDKGGAVAGVLLCGHGTQELVGVAAPTAYRARYDPRGNTRPEEEVICWETKQDGAFRKAVSGLLGKDLETLWTRHTPPTGETLDVVPPR